MKAQPRMPSSQGSRAEQSLRLSLADFPVSSGVKSLPTPCRKLDPCSFLRSRLDQPEPWSNMESQEDLTLTLSISDSKNVMAIPLSRHDKSSCLHVFTNPHQESVPTDNFSNSTSKKKIKLALEHFDFIHFATLVQFWGPTIAENQQVFLDTSDLPFGLSVLRRGLCLFRKRCLKLRYCVYGENLGPPGRAYLRRFPEFCPDVVRYSGEEYDLKDFAGAIGVRGYVALPVFEPDWNFCIGVLEILTVMDGNYCLNDVIGKVSDLLKAVGLRSSDVFWPFDVKSLEYEIDPSGHELTLNEIQRVVDVLCNAHRLPFAQTWVVPSDKSCIESVMMTTKMGSYLSTEKVRLFQSDCMKFHLRKGQGIVWKAFSSGASCFCRDITQLSVSDYSLVLSARKADLTGGFSVCLQSTCSGKFVYIIELFLPANQSIYRKPLVFLKSLLGTMKPQFQTFKFSSGHEEENELLVEVLKVSKDDIDSFVICQTAHDGEGLNNRGNKARLTSCHQSIEIGIAGSGLENTKTKQDSIERETVHLHTSTDSRRNTINTQQNAVPLNTDIGAVKTLKLGDIFSNEVHGEQSRKIRRDSSDNPSVNRSKSNNLNTEPNINRLAPQKKRKVDLSRTQNKSSKEAGNCTVESGQILKSSNVSTNESCTSGACFMPVPNPMQNEGSVITIKAECKGDIIKFQLSVPFGMMELRDEIMKRFNLTAETFEIKHRCEGDVWILLDSDAALQQLLSSIRSLYTSTVKLSVVLIAPQMLARENMGHLTVRASYEDAIFEFQLSPSSMMNLKDEVMKRFNLEVESFEVKYADEKSSWILLDSDADLENCIHTLASLHNTTMKICILPVNGRPAMNPECIMTVKASCGEDTIKFQLSPLSGLMDLKSEVTKRLDIEARSFEIIYADESNCPLLLDSDRALKDCIHKLTLLQKTTMKICIQPTRARPTISPECKMIVKASYGEDIIKFQLSPLSGLLDLKNEVTTRLDLGAESFEIKYADEKNCHILLNSDAALEDCIHKLTLSQRTTLRLSIQPIRV